MNYDLTCLFGKMCRDFSLAEMAGTSSPSSLSWSASGMSADGDVLTLNTSEWPNEGDGYSVCSLAAILEPHVAPKYYLSSRACQGVLRRAERRGRTLPEALQRALVTMAGLAPEETEALT